MKKSPIVIIGAGPYGLSTAAHLGARGTEHRIFGQPMSFWRQIASAGGERYLKSYCFGTDISTPAPGFSFAEYNRPRGLETYEPCSIDNFACYGQWFQQRKAPWVEPVDVAHVARRSANFTITLTNGEELPAAHVVVATGLANFAHVPHILASLPPGLVTHTSRIAAFAAFKGKTVAVIGGGQSALEAAALLHEAGALPEILVREGAVLWQEQVPLKRSLWRRLRSPVSGLGSGPKAWALTHFPGAMRRAPNTWRMRFVNRHLPAEGAWWLRSRVRDKVPIHIGTTVVEAREEQSGVALRLRVAGCGTERRLKVDHVVAGSGYNVDIDRLSFLDPKLRDAIRRIESAPWLSPAFEASVPGLHFIGPSSALSFGPLFRFVAGAQYSARMVSSHLVSQV